MAKYDCDNPRPLQVCEPAPVPPAPEPCPEWEVCLPFQGRLYSREGCIRLEKGSPPPDGVYSKLTIIDGCIVSAEKADPAMYAGASCAPVPCACGEAGAGGTGGSGSLPEPSRNDGNLFEYDLSGRPLVRVTATGGDGVSVTGTGTTADPLVISAASSGTGIYMRPGNSSIEISGSGTRDDPYVITHADGHEANINGMRFDARGHLIGFTQGSESSIGVNGIVQGKYIQVEIDKQTKIATIAMQPPATVTSEQISIGNTSLNIIDGFIVGAVSEWQLTPATVQLSDYLISIAEGGVIQGYQYNPEGNPLRELEQKIKDMAGESHVVAGSGIFADVYNQGSYSLADNPLDFELDVVTAQEGGFLIEFFSDPQRTVVISGSGDESDIRYVINTTPYTISSVTVDGKPVQFSYNCDAVPSLLYIPGPFAPDAHIVSVNDIRFESPYYSISKNNRKEIKQLARLSVVGGMSFSNSTVE